MKGRRLLIAGDIGALLAFALLGLATHERELTLIALARSFLPFAVVWLLVASVLGGFQPDADGRPVSGWGIVLLWLPAGVLGVVLRSMVFERTLFTAFLAVALIGDGLFLLAWRWFYTSVLLKGGSLPLDGSAASAGDPRMATESER